MTWEVLGGDCRELLRTLPEESVQCVVTSPPYWGLRDYGLEPTIWGDEDGGEGCEHEWTDVTKRGGGTYEQGSKRRWNHGVTMEEQPSLRGHPDVPAGSFCLNCTAWRGSLGLEPTPDLYGEHLVEVFRGVKRVLRKDGVVFLNLGDSYANLNHAPGTTAKVNNSKAWGNIKLNSGKIPPGLKAKDLVGMPWRVAFALQADGWWLRSEIIWSKPNPMPESVTDRPTRAHEQVFLLTKSARYFYDADAVREPMAPLSASRYAYAFGGPKNEALKNGDKPTAVVGERNVTAGRNLRSVWTIPTEAFSEAHFATFPKKLVEPCVKAGSRPGDTVLDPFCGSGTVGVVARGHGRSFIGIELSETYADMARRRISGTKRGLDEDGTPLWEQETMFS